MKAKWTFRILLMAAMCALAGPGFGAEDVIVRAKTSLTEAWIGQRVMLYIEVLGKNGWAQVPNLKNFEVPGTYIMRTETQGVRLQETIDGDSYTGQRYELSIYPQTAGQINIPSLDLNISCGIFL